VVLAWIALVVAGPFLFTTSSPNNFSPGLLEQVAGDDYPSDYGDDEDDAGDAVSGGAEVAVVLLILQANLAWMLCPLLSSASILCLLGRPAWALLRGDRGYFEREDHLGGFSTPRALSLRPKSAHSEQSPAGSTDLLTPPAPDLPRT